MLVAQACELHKRYPTGMPASDRFNERVAGDALLEGTVVHLRLLDHFPRQQGELSLDVRAVAETRERGCVPIVSLRKTSPIPLDRILYGSDEWKRSASIVAAPPSSASSAA
jgi:hypothetical protein